MEPGRPWWLREARPVWPSIGRWETILIGFGIVARAAAYLNDRPFWLDEGSLAANLTEIGILDFSGPLINDQLAPIGFLVLGRLIAMVLGGSNWALRLIPLSAGIGGLFLMRAIARRLLKPRAAVVALALFALGDDLIYYSVELKPYSSDVFVALCCLWSALRLQADKTISAAKFALLGCLAVSFSFSSAFILAGFGTVMIVQRLFDRKRSEACRLTLVAAVWSCAFATTYFIYSRSLISKTTSLWVFWGFAFPPKPLSIGPALGWTARIFLNMFINPLGFNTPFGAWLSIVSPAILFGVGSVGFARRDLRRFALLVAPIGFAMAAGATRLYPFYGRLILWTAPIVYVITAEGIDVLVGENRPAFAVVSAAILCFPALYGLAHVFSPRQRDDFHPRGDLRKDAIVDRPIRVAPIAPRLTKVPTLPIRATERFAHPLESPTSFGQTRLEEIDGWARKNG